MCGPCIAVGVVAVLLLLAYIGSSDSVSGYDNYPSSNVKGSALKNVMRGGSAVASGFSSKYNDFLSGLTTKPKYNDYLSGMAAKPKYNDYLSGMATLKRPVNPYQSMYAR